MQQPELITGHIELPGESQKYTVPGEDCTSYTCPCISWNHSNGTTLVFWKVTIYRKCIDICLDQFDDHFNTESFLPCVFYSIFVKSDPSKPPPMFDSHGL